MRMYEILKAKTLIFLLFFSSKINKISRYFHIFKMCKMQAAITNTRMEDRKGERTQMCQSLQCMCICMCILIQKIIQRVGVFNELSTSFSLPLTQIRRQIRDLNKTLGSFSFQAAIHQSFSTTALLKFGGHFLFFWRWFSCALQDSFFAAPWPVSFRCHRHPSPTMFPGIAKCPLDRVGGSQPVENHCHILKYSASWRAESCNMHSWQPEYT